ncbi:MAG: hydroxyacid dehydrogenase [Planctomycetes bacterium]|nr:hydroxyacid dehydrogenase [Planctomycetota bacterium]
MHRIWFERSPPEAYHSLLVGRAEVAGAASETPETPFLGLEDSDGVIAGGRLQYGAAFMDRAPRLRVIARTGIGYDNVDLVEATARRIVVCNVPDGPTRSTAEHTMTLLLALAKDVKRIERRLAQGQRQDYFQTHRGIEVHGRILGLVGLGRIGRQVARLAGAMGMSVLGYDPYLQADTVAGMGVTAVSSLETLLRQSDFVSLHLPLTPETRYLLNAERLRQMKPGSYLLNCARGGLVDETALIKALDSGPLQGAGLDVFEQEPPPPNHPLLNRDDVIATPHIAAATDAAKRALWTSALTQTLQLLNNELPPHVVNPEAWRRDDEES